MSNNTLRFTKLLGECRRQMNGAVAGSMRYYGADYGLNYGVSIPTVRSLAALEGKDHIYAKYLYLQQVREIRLASLHIAEAEKITKEELDFWAEGIINSEVAEEAAFALFQHVDHVVDWLGSDNELFVYTALLSIAKSRRVDLQSLGGQIIEIASRDSLLMASAVTTLLENYYHSEERNRVVVSKIVADLPESKTSKEIREELSWRCDI